MERIKFLSDDMSFATSKISKLETKINFSEIKSFLCEVDNNSFDQIRLKVKPNLNKIVIDIATGIRYPAFDDFTTKIKQSKFGNLFDFK